MYKKNPIKFFVLFFVFFFIIFFSVLYFSKNNNNFLDKNKSIDNVFVDDLVVINGNPCIFNSSNLVFDNDQVIVSCDDILSR